LGNKKIGQKKKKVQLGEMCTSDIWGAIVCQGYNGGDDVIDKWCYLLETAEEIKDHMV
jgi:hypothetical protein